MRFDKLDLNLLVALDALLEGRSVSWAAQRLHLSQPALSGCLNRLREYFQDELLYQSGRQMVLTPKAQELTGPVRQALMLIRSKITNPGQFDPSTAERRFAIVASDYAYDVLIAECIGEATRLAPKVTYDVATTDRYVYERLDRGEVDLLITVSPYLSESHPHVPLYTDEHTVVAWSCGRYRDGIDAQAFLAAGHAVVVFGADRFPSFTESYFSQQGVERNIELRVPSFSALPQGVIGTNRIATMYRRHAEYFAQHLPIRVYPAPVPLPNVLEAAQWHTMRDSDEGLRWFVSILAAKAAKLSFSNVNAAREALPSEIAENPAIVGV